MIDYFAPFRERHPESFAQYDSPERQGAPAVLRISGGIDTESARDFLDCTLAALADLTTGTELVIRLDGVQYISSAGVGALARILAEAETRKISMCFKGISASCRDVFSVLGLLRYFNVQESETV
ncbi:MAG TPA: STAS domain-containing protein [bacterium]|nr:STAS domain-containing protein [bacterium]